MIPPPPRSTLFPYTTLFRSVPEETSKTGIRRIVDMEPLLLRWLDYYIRSDRSEEHTSELQSLTNLVCRLLLEKKKKVVRSETSRTKSARTSAIHTTNSEHRR